MLNIFLPILVRLLRNCFACELFTHVPYAFKKVKLAIWLHNFTQFNDPFIWVKLEADKHSCTILEKRANQCYSLSMFKIFELEIAFLIAATYFPFIFPLLCRRPNWCRSFRALFTAVVNILALFTTTMFLRAKFLKPKSRMVKFEKQICFEKECIL